MYIALNQNPFRAPTERHVVCHHPFTCRSYGAGQLGPLLSETDYGKLLGA